MISQTLNQRKSKKSVVTRGPRGSSLFSFTGKGLCSRMNAIKKPDMQLHIGLNQSVIKADDVLIMIFFELLYSY